MICMAVSMTCGGGEMPRDPVGHYGSQAGTPQRDQQKQPMPSQRQAVPDALADGIEGVAVRPV